MTVFHNGVPVEDIELELFKFVAVFINKYDLQEHIFTDLLGTIELSEIQSELILAVVESCPSIKNNYHRMYTLLWNIFYHLFQYSDHKFHSIHQRVAIT
jgi:hypothetical protein